MSAYTPGPWVAKNHHGAGWGIWADLRPALGETAAKDFPLCGSDALKTQQIQIAYETWVQFPSEAFNATQAGNMRLMAAAPELLDALRELHVACNGNSDEEISARIRARLIIAKATGDAP